MRKMFCVVVPLLLMVVFAMAVMATSNNDAQPGEDAVSVDTACPSMGSANDLRTSDNTDADTLNANDGNGVSVLTCFDCEAVSLNTDESDLFYVHRDENKNANDGTNYNHPMEDTRWSGTDTVSLMRSGAPLHRWVMA